MTVTSCPQHRRKSRIWRLGCFSRWRRLARLPTQFGQRILLASKLLLNAAPPPASERLTQSTGWAHWTQNFRLHFASASRFTNTWQPCCLNTNYDWTISSLILAGSALRAHGRQTFLRSRKTGLPVCSWVVAKSSHTKGSKFLLRRFVRRATRKAYSLFLAASVSKQSGWQQKD